MSSILLLVSFFLLSFFISFFLFIFLALFLYFFFFVIGYCRQSGPECVRDLETLKAELELYMPGLTERGGLVIGNKIDMPGAWDAYEHLQGATELLVVPVSSLHGRGVPKVTQSLRDQVEAQLPKPSTSEQRRRFEDELFFSRYHQPKGSSNGSR